MGYRETLWTISAIFEVWISKWEVKKELLMAKAGVTKATN